MYTAVNSHTDESLPHFPLRDTSLVISPTFRQKPLSNSRAALFILLIRPAWKYVFSIWPRSFYIIRGRVRAISFRPCDVVSRKKRRRRRRERNAIRINRQRRGQMVVDRGGARRKRDGMDNPTGP